MKKLFTVIGLLVLCICLYGQNTQSLVVTYLGKQGEPLPKLDNKNIRADVAIVTFEKGSGRFAFDTWLDYYESVSIISSKGVYERMNAGDKGAYNVPWKFLPEGESDVVRAKIELIDRNFDPEKVIFSTPQGVIFNHTYDSKTKTYTLTLVAGQDNDVQEIYALNKLSSDNYQTLGKLNVITYRKQTPKLKVVFVNEHKIDANSLKKELDNIYLPVGVDWQISTDEFSHSVSNSFFEKGSGLLQAYNEQMLDLQRAYRDAKGIDRNTSYIFILNHSGDNNNRHTSGFMPRGKQFGYIFLSNIPRNEVNNVIAHELGHGQWKLRHTFDDSYGQTAVGMQGKTNNLMDYASGTHLAKWQWDIMSVPAIFDGILDGDEEAMFASGWAISPDFKYFVSIPNTNTAAAIKNVPGTLSGFFLDEVFYQWDSSDYTPSNRVNKVEISKGLSDDAKVYFLYNLEQGCEGSTFIRITYSELKKNLATTNKTLQEYVNDNGLERRKIPCATDVNADTGVKRFITDRITQDYVDLARRRGVEAVESLEQKESIINELVRLVEQEKNKNDKSEDYFGKVLADKLKTYEVHNNRKFIVVQLPINYITNIQNSWNLLAEKVFEQAGLTANDILITVPLAVCEGVFGARDAKIYYMPGLAYGNNIQINKERLRTDYSNTKSITEIGAGYRPEGVLAYVADIFTHTKKKYEQSIYYINFRGDISERTETEEKSGFPGTFDYRLYKDSRFDRFVSLLNNIDNFSNLPHYEYVPGISESTVRMFENAMAEFLSDTSPGTDILIPHGLNEFHGSSNPDVRRQFALWFRDRQRADNPAPESFYLGRNPVIYDEDIRSFAIASVILSPFQLDWIAEGLGAIYAAYYGDWLNASLFGAGAVISLSVTSVRALGSVPRKTAVLRGEAVIVREGNTYVARNVTELIGRGGTYIENLTRYKQLFREGKLTELFAELKKTTAFPKMGKTTNVSYENLLKEYNSLPNALPNHCPYMKGRIGTNFELEEVGYFVRVYDEIGSQRAGKWLFRIEDLRAYKNVDELVEGLALPSRPTKVALVEVPEGTMLRKTIVGEQEWVQGKVLKGGGTQYELLENINIESFQPLFNNINDFFK